MMDEFLEMLKKRKQKQGPVDDKKLKANANVMESLSKMLGEDLTEGIKGAKKVTVSSNSNEGLKEGLNKAENIIEKKIKKEDSEDEMDEESEMEDESEDESENESEDESDLKSQIATLKQEIENLKKRT